MNKRITQRVIPNTFKLFLEDKEIDFVVYVDFNMCTAKAFKGKNTKRSCLYKKYISKESMLAEITSYQETYHEIKKCKENEKLLKKNFDYGIVKVGDIFVGLWGYEQTNVDFYQVIYKKNRMVTLRSISANSLYETSYSSDVCEPVKDNFLTGKRDETITKRLENNGSYPYVNYNSYITLFLHESQKTYHRSWGY